MFHGVMLLILQEILICMIKYNDLNPRIRELNIDGIKLYDLRQKQKQI
jgi:hypothetical protein